MDKLNEVLNYEGLVYLGGNGVYEVYDATTWDAAQHLVHAGDDRRAGDAWAQNENTFNQHVGPNAPLYFFVQANTNRVDAAAIRQPNNSLHLRTDVGDFTTQTNYAIEDRGGALAVDHKNLPLYVLPRFTCTLPGGLLIENNILKGVFLGVLNPDNTQEEVVIPAGVTTIEANVFSNAYPRNFIKIPDSVNTVAANAFSNYSGTIEVAANALEADSWSPEWAPNAHIVHRPGAAPQENPQENTENVLNAPEASTPENTPTPAAEPETIPAEVGGQRLSWQEKKQRVQELPDEEVLYYETVRRRSKEKNAEGRWEYTPEIVILGCWKGRDNLDIPEQIDGKPVTEIAPFAFYNQPMRRINLPKTIKIIGSGAFMDTNAIVQYYSSPDLRKVANSFKGARPRVMLGGI